MLMVQDHFTQTACIFQVGTPPVNLSLYSSLVLLIGPLYISQDGAGRTPKFFSPTYRQFYNHGTFYNFPILSFIPCLFIIVPYI